MMDKQQHTQNAVQAINKGEYMAEEVTKISEVKTSSDGSVHIALETYNDLVARAAVKPPVINRTTVIKTDEMVAEDYRMLGIGFMGLGTAFFTIGVILYRAGRM